MSVSAKRSQTAASLANSEQDKVRHRCLERNQLPGRYYVGRVAMRAQDPERYMIVRHQRDQA